MFILWIYIMQVTYCGVMEKIKHSWSVETYFVFILWFIEFEKNYTQNNEHCMHVRQKLFISFYITGFCAPISFWRLNILRNLNTCIPFHECLLRGRRHLIFWKYASALMHSDTIVWKNVSILKAHCIYFCTIL